jgi:hypothetical protein
MRLGLGVGERISFPMASPRVLLIFHDEHLAGEALRKRGSLL